MRPIAGQQPEAWPGLAGTPPDVSWYARPPAGGPKRRPASGRLALAVVLATFSAVTPAVSASGGAGEFAVKLDGLLRPALDDPRLSCAPNSRGGRDCDGRIAREKIGERSRGKVRHDPTGAEGTISTDCDIDSQLNFQLRKTDRGATEPLNFAGSGSIACGWHMDFGEAGTLTGALVGSIEPEVADRQAGTVALRMELSATAVHGTGQFAGMEGKGVAKGSQELPADELVGDHRASAAARLGRAPVSAASHGGGHALVELLIEMVVIEPISSVVIPGFRAMRQEGYYSLAEKSAYSLHAVTEPGTACTARARKGERRVGLGGARADQDGNVRFRGRLAKRLGSRGRWKVRVSCPGAGGGGKTGRAEIGVGVE